MNSEILENMGLGDLDVFYIFLILFILIIVLLIFIIIQTSTTLNLKRRMRAFMSGRNAQSLESGIASIYKDISMLKEHDVRFRSDIRDIQNNLLDCYQKVGVVKYDAFREMGGQLSFSIAMLDKQDNGFILNSVHSANGCYTYTKEIQNGVCAIDLADEEREALNRAMRVSTGSYAIPKTDLNGNRMYSQAQAQIQPEMQPAMQDEGGYIDPRYAYDGMNYGGQSAGYTEQQFDNEGIDYRNSDYNA